MVGVALSDLHLGFTQFNRTIDGRNGRQVDVERALERAADIIVEVQPEIVTLGGDNTHRVDVSNYALKALIRFTRRVITETRAHLVVIPGNHEGARTVEALSPVHLLEGFDRVHVVTKPEQIRFTTASQTSVAVWCIPFGVLMRGTTIEPKPDPFSDVNIMLVHAAVQTSKVHGALPRFYVHDNSFDIGAIADQWDVIACGDFHEFTRLHPSALAFYSGSIERTSSNIWDESKPKGLVVYDTEAKTLELREIPTRPVLSFNAAELPIPTPYDGLAADVNAAMRAILGCPIEGAIVRMIAPDFPATERGELDQQLVREIRQRAFHFYLDERRPARQEIAESDRRLAPVRTLVDVARDAFAGEPDEVRACAMGYLQQALEAA